MPTVYKAFPALLYYHLIHTGKHRIEGPAAAMEISFAFAFDPERSAIVLCGGDKSGVSEKLFYRQLIAKADARFDVHVARITRQRKERK